jgi:hypothetical protein
VAGTFIETGIVSVFIVTLEQRIVAVEDGRIDERPLIHSQTSP